MPSSRIKWNVLEDFWILGFHMENVSGRVIILHFNIVVISVSQHLKGKKINNIFQLDHLHAHSDVIIKITVYIGFFNKFGRKPWPIIMLHKLIDMHQALISIEISYLAFKSDVTAVFHCHIWLVLRHVLATMKVSLYSDSSHIFVYSLDWY